jgi:hypothetical protein
MAPSQIHIIGIVRSIPVVSLSLFMLFFRPIGTPLQIGSPETRSLVLSSDSSRYGSCSVQGEAISPHPDTHERSYGFLRHGLSPCFSCAFAGARATRSAYRRLTKCALRGLLYLAPRISCLSCSFEERICLVFERFELRQGFPFFV